MRHTLKLNGVVIGWSELEEVDPADRRVWGQFHPGFGYDLVEPVFRLFVEATPMPGGEPLDQIGHRRIAASFTRRARRRNGSRSAARSSIVRTNAWSASASRQNSRRPPVTIARAR